MSADEDTELRDLVAQTLEANGTLGKLRAQLRASVFLALEEQEQVQNRTPLLNKELSHFLSTQDGQLLTSLVQEFLEYFHLEFTAAVFQPETGLTEEAESRATLAKELKQRTGEGDGHAQCPLLMQLLQNCQHNAASPQHTPLSRSNTSHLHTEEDRVCNGVPHLPKGLTEKQIEDARKKFEEYDRDGSGAIEKDELRELFMDMFPAFNANMLERYVNDEFRAVDRDFSSSIDFDEFLGMYKRLFLQCRAVVAGDVEDIISTAHKTSAQSPTHKSGSMVNSVEVNNQRNVEKSAPPLPSTPPPKSGSISSGSGLGNELDDLLGGNDDSFFDDLLPTAGGLNLNNSGGSRSMNGGRSSSSSDKSRPSHIPVRASVRSESDKGGEKDGGKIGNGAKGKTTGSSMSSLGDLPFLNSGSRTSATNSKPSGPKGKEAESSLRSLDRRMADLGIDNDMQDDFEYEDDFLSSGHSLSQKSPRGKGDQSRGDKERDRTENGSIAEEIDDEEIEDISIEADDLLKSENSGFEDMTEDRSISQIDGSFDYMEDPQLP